MHSSHRSFLKTHLLFIASLLILSTQVSAKTTLYRQHNLVSDGSVVADHMDPHLVNPWGLAFGTTSPGWVSNNGTGTSTIYDGKGNPSSLVVTIPAAQAGKTGTPSGMVFNNTGKWVVKSNEKSASALFIFVTEDGTISGWSPGVDTTHAIIAVNHSTEKANYKGIAIGANGQNAFLFVTNFYSGKVETFDEQFHPVNLLNGFIDPDLPTGYAPFGIQNISGDIYVTYGKQDAMKRDAVNGIGLGIVNAFDAKGHFLRRIATGGQLNAPWAIVVTPNSFGSAGDRLLIGNFGDGRINIFGTKNDKFYGQLKGTDRMPVSIDGLWSLGFGNGFMNQPTNVLFFTAGPGDENHGLYGTLNPAS